MNKPLIDLFSDTITRPTEGMRAFMAAAEVGDEQRREDPTVNRLEEKVCQLLGKENAVFLPSGTMCNQIAMRVHCQPGDEIICESSCHLRSFEGGGASALSGASINNIEGKNGVYTLAQMEASVRPKEHHSPQSRVVSIEQTANMGGGTIWPLETIQELCSRATQLGLARHMDGARLLNAVVATGISAQTYSENFDSVWIDFSKGLGAPVGAALAGSKDFISKAWRFKHQFGGAMRQSGIIAAGALYSLEHHVERLAEDHANAKLLADGLADIDGINAEPSDTNIVFIDVSGLCLTAEQFSKRLLTHGVRVSITRKTHMRAVTHLDVSRSQIEEALVAFERTARELSNN